MDGTFVQDAVDGYKNLDDRSTKRPVVGSDALREIR
jgi:hypothetical protein